ncbi:M20 metallopeptidase family protein [Paenibacillus azoreducens]|nr:amidohydrolase [Paenibacillus azoreducens]
MTGTWTLTELQQTRRTLHAWPEIAGKEERTRKFVRRFIENRTSKINILYDGDNGVIAQYDAGGNAPTVAFRAELDGLPLLDGKQVDYRSRNEGMHHACGHDAHMTILLYFLLYVDSLEECDANVLFVFQSAEEVFAGARELLPILQPLGIDYMYALHVTPNLYAGYFSLRPAKMMAGSLTIEIAADLVHGHAAENSGITDLLAVIDRFCKEYNQGNQRCIVTHVNTNGYYNVTASELKMYVNFRSEETANSRIGLQLLQSCIAGHPWVRDMEVTEISAYPALYNDETLTTLTTSVFKKRFGDQWVLECPFLFSSDDFSFYGDLPGIKTCYYFIGSYLGDEIKVHTETFDIDEKCLLYGLESFKVILKLVRHLKRSS